MRKTIAILSISMIMVFLSATIALGAMMIPMLGTVHDIGGDFTSDLLGYSQDFNNWYTVGNTAPHFDFHYFYGDQYSSSSLGYYQNDQTFLEASHAGIYVNLNNVRGSYLFNDGLFLGFNDYYVAGTSVTFIAPGFRLNFNDNAYAALSIDYESTDRYHGISGYDLDFKYADDSAKIWGQFYRSKSNGENFYDLAGNFKVNDGMVIGLAYRDYAGFTSYWGGFTWNREKFIVDTMVGKFSNFFFRRAPGPNPGKESIYAISGVYNVSDNLGIGVKYSYNDYISGLLLTDHGHTESLKLKYSLEKSAFSLEYCLDNNYHPQLYYLNYELTF